MMRLALVFAAIIAFAVFAVSQVPLGFVLRRLPLNAMGVQWTQTEGTIWDGRVMGVYLNAQPLGDVDVSLDPLSLISLQPGMDIQWGGAGGRGAARFTILDRYSFQASDLRVEQRVAALESLSSELRSIGGTLRVGQGAVTINGAQCVSATGNLQADTLALAARQFGRTFSDLTGTVSCEDGAFRIIMNGTGPDGDSVAIAANANMLGRADINVVANTADRDLQALLANAGFSRQDGQWIYQRTSDPAGADAP